MTADRCRTCGDLNGHSSPVAAAECALHAAYLADLLGCCAPDDTPLRRAVADLFAHMQDVYSDGQRAHHAVRMVLGLGWRPTVGVGGAS